MTISSVSSLYHPMNFLQREQKSKRSRNTDQEDSKIKVQETQIILTQRDLPSIQDEDKATSSYWSGKEFEQVSEELHKSYVSSALALDDDEIYDYERQQPYDWTTQRRARKFFKEDLANLTRATMNKEYVQQMYGAEAVRDMPKIYLSEETIASPHLNQWSLG